MKNARDVFEVDGQKFQWPELALRQDLKEKSGRNANFWRRITSLKAWVDLAPLNLDTKNLLLQCGYGKLEYLKRVQKRYGWEKAKYIIATHRLDFNEVCKHLLDRKQARTDLVDESVGIAPKMAYSDLQQAKLLVSLLEAAGTVVVAMREAGLQVPDRAKTLAAGIGGEVMV
jgi:hypothetical protein